MSTPLEPSQVVIGSLFNEPMLQEPVKNSAQFPWNEVVKVKHYWLKVDAMTWSMEVREYQNIYGKSNDV